MNEQQVEHRLEAYSIWIDGLNFREVGEKMNLSPSRARRLALHGKKIVEIRKLVKCPQCKKMVKKVFRSLIGMTCWSCWEQANNFSCDRHR